MLQKTLLVISSVLVLSCTDIPRPKGEICLFDAPRMRNLCLDMQNDFDKSGNVKPDAQWKVHEIKSLADLDKHTNFDPDSWSQASGYLRKVEQAYDELKNQQ